MAKSTEVMSLSLRPDVHQKLRDYAEKYYKGNKSDLASNLFEDFSSINPEVHETLKKAADSRKVSVSELVEFLVDRFPLDNVKVRPIVLKIPVDIIADKGNLETWLTTRVNAILDHLHPR